MNSIDAIQTDRDLESAIQQNLKICREVAASVC
jgi:hypothetical protein